MQIPLIAAIVVSSLGIGGGASAEWELVGKKAAYTLYIDSRSIRRAGDVAKMWAMFDYRSVQSIGEHSVRSIGYDFQFNCGEASIDRGPELRYAEPMGRGTPVAARPATDAAWIPVAAGTLAETMWDIACLLHAPDRWEYVGSHRDERYYYDPTVIHKAGEISKVRLLIDRGAPRAGGKGATYLSTKLLYTYNCQEDTHRPGVTADYDGRMGTGRLVRYSAGKSSAYARLHLSATIATTWELACGKS